MPRTVIGLFENTGLADAAVHDIEALGFPHSEIRSLAEPLDFGVTGVMSTPRLDFEVQLTRELIRIGATKSQAENYVDRVRRKAVLVFATGSPERVEAAAFTMNHCGAMDLEELAGPEPILPSVSVGNMTPEIDASVQTGRERSSGGGARAFVW